MTGRTENPDPVCDTVSRLVRWCDRRVTAGTRSRAVGHSVGRSPPSTNPAPTPASASAALTLSRPSCFINLTAAALCLPCLCHNDPLYDSEPTSTLNSHSIGLLSHGATSLRPTPSRAVLSEYVQISRTTPLKCALTSAIQIPERPQNPCLVALQTLRPSKKAIRNTTSIPRHKMIFASQNS